MKNLHKTFWLGPIGMLDNDEVDAIHFQVAKGTGEDDFLYEFSIVLIQFNDGFAMQSKVFSDSWEAYEDCPELWKLLTSMNNCFRGEYGRVKEPKPFDDLVKELKKLGWKGGERKQSRYYKMCSKCHQDIPVR